MARATFITRTGPGFMQILLMLLAVALAPPGFAAKGGNGGGGNGGGDSYTVGGSVSGLQSADVVTLQMESGSSSEAITTGNGPFTFANSLPRRSSYSVTVSAQPEAATCVVENGSGTINKRDISNVNVLCSYEPVATTYSIGGTLSGLAEGSSVTLSNLGEELVLAANGDFTFPSALADGTGYNVTVAAQPAGQSCAVANAAGTVSGADVADVTVSCETTAVTLTRLEGAGDSIMRGYNASCTGNTGFLDLFCYSGGDQNQNSFLDGSSSNVVSLLDRYLAQQANFSGSKAASVSGAEMTAADKNNFASQASAIVAATSQPTVVVVELGGNDLCNRSSDADLYSDAVWQGAVQAGLDVLVNHLPDGSTVYLSSVPRVQDLRAVGLAKQAAESGVDCASFWSSFDVCRIATASDTYFDALQERQRRYNEILAEQAAAYNADALTTGVEVVAEYQAVIADSTVSAVGNFAFTPSQINGGDCFHPSISGQNKVAEILWNNNPFR
ncbi:SGNH/GDSL hydrolase family protein [Seongchinamella sediminis]|nr:SGNH/GDSL hydrolase family protein [Seongchinamella sediminis]